MISGISISPVDRAAARAMHERICQLAKPIGSLGRIEELAEWLAAIHGGFPPDGYERRAIVVGAADHGVAGEDAGAYPPGATAQMVAAFLGGHAAIDALGRAVRADVYVADFGLSGKLPAHERFFEMGVAAGTRNIGSGAAMPADHVDAALSAGARAFARVRDHGEPQIIALGDMGAANAISAAALVCALTGAQPEDVAGRAGAADEERSRRTLALVASASERVRDADWRAIAAGAGGYEIIGLAGVLLAAAQARMPILLDGFVVGAAALLARAIEPASVEYCVASHRSRETGHPVVLRALGLVPLLDLDLRLGQGCGAALGFPLCDAAARMVCEMKTHAEVAQGRAE